MGKNLLDNGIDPHYMVETEGIFKGCNSLHIAGFYGNTMTDNLGISCSKLLPMKNLQKYINEK